MTDNGHPHTTQNRDGVRVAVVGAGQFGELHADAYRANPDCRLVAIVDRNLERARAVAARTGAPAAYASIEELLANEQVDGVSIATAGAHHLAPTIAALRAGASVLLEKPVVLRADEAITLADAAGQAAGFVLPAHILRFAAPYRELANRLAAGAVGTPRALSFRRHRTIEHDSLFPDVHPVLMTMVHDIDLALWLDGSRPTSVTARQLRIAGRAQPAVVWAEVKTDSGSIWSFQVSWSLAGAGGLPDALEVIGDSGALSLSLGARVSDFGPSAAAVDDTLTPGGSHGALGEEVRAFVDAIRFGIAPAGPTLGEAIDGLALAHRIIQAAESGATGPEPHGEGCPA
ncbi:Gfo/Idh/MocA family protein [Microterricola pindariensis]|uniref:Gfo/Idh/MocA-like oxidoreductase N-terminal domain-containing protein n=1 Tax=Microterricola pindariensis TaxID=478010 RepID=A0ABX5AYZ1_9MICO|nr:Gfo/Idh/MocA family oxidoreductase [Microterricola pindariensis]PPL19564.1 hypothetical protein GY24_05090 [Microterricola pindariensis]